MHQRWIVTTSADRPIRQIAKDLDEAGFTVDRVLDAAGVVTGSAADAILPKLRAIEGVVNVSPDRAIRIGLPDADDQA